MKLKKLGLVALLSLFGISLASCNNKESVVIYSSLEDFRNDMVKEELTKQFPDININIQYYPTGTHAAKLKAEGSKTEADIFLDLETSYCEALKDNFADLDNDTSNYVEEVLPPHDKYNIYCKEAGCVILNNKVLAEKGLEKPTSYEDLLKAEYKDLIVMPNPKSSSTGFYFYNSLYSTWGEEKTLTYFEDLSKNVKQFSESGSGPVKMVDKGEIAIGLGMTFQAMTFVEKNDDLEVMFFEEGSPYSLYGMGIIKGHETNPTVKKVYDYIFDTVVMKDKELFNPEKIYKEQVTSVIKNYPTDIKYSKMDGLFDANHKNNLLDKWKW